MSMHDRIKVNFDNRNSGGGTKNYSGLVFGHLKEKPEFLKMEGNKKYVINIIPYTVGAKHPSILLPKSHGAHLEVGQRDYQLIYATHRGIGSDDSVVICPKKTYGKPCPICEEHARLAKKGADPKDLQALVASLRVLYNIEVIDENGAGELKLLSVSQFLFDKVLLDAWGDAESEDGEIDFTDPTVNGRSIRFRTILTSRPTGFGKISFLEFSGWSFPKRQAPVSDENLKKAIQLDSLLDIKSYDELKKIFLEGASEEPELDAPFPDSPAEYEKSAEQLADSADNDVAESSKAVKAPPVAQDCPFGYKFGTAFENEDCYTCEKSAACQNYVAY